MRRSYHTFNLNLTPNSSYDGNFTDAAPTTLLALRGLPTLGSNSKGQILHQSFTTYTVAPIRTVLQHRAPQEDVPSTSIASISPYLPRPAPSISVTRDGKCGGNTGWICAGQPWGDCCNASNHCGSTDADCGTGCQRSFRDCLGPPLIPGGTSELYELGTGPVSTTVSASISPAPAPPPSTTQTSIMQSSTTKPSTIKPSTIQSSTAPPSTLLFSTSSSSPFSTSLPSTSTSSPLSTSLPSTSILSRSTETKTGGTLASNAIQIPLPESALPGHEGLGKMTTTEVVGISLGGLAFLIFLGYLVRRLQKSRPRKISKLIPIRRPSDALPPLPPQDYNTNNFQPFSPTRAPQSLGLFTEGTVVSIRPQSSISQRMARSDSYIDVNSLSRFLLHLPNGQRGWEEWHPQTPLTNQRIATNNPYEYMRIDDPLRYETNQQVHLSARDRPLEQTHLRPDVVEPSPYMNDSQVVHHPWGKAHWALADDI